MRGDNSRARWIHKRSRQERRWRELGDKVSLDPTTACGISSRIDHGVAHPRQALAAMELRELLLLFQLAHLAIGEGLLRASDPRLE